MYVPAHSSTPTLRTAAALLLVTAYAAPALAQQSLVNTTTSFSTSNQSIWSSGNAFIYNFNQFVGIDSGGYSTATIGSGSGDTVSAAGYKVNPYTTMRSAYRVGMDLGAEINGGSINANLDYNLSLFAPDTIKQGQQFSLTGSASKLNSSSFSTTATNASAYIDGVVDLDFDIYSRFEVDRPFPLSTQDLRLGNKGFTSGSSSNTPYYSLVNIHKAQEVIGINRNQSGYIRHLGGQDFTDGDLLYDTVGSGDSVNYGPISFTAGNWNVDANGNLVGTGLSGGNNETLVTATLDIDQLMIGSAALGQGIAHDWGLIDYDIGYDILNYEANLDIGLDQQFELMDTMMITLTFSDDVEIEGVGVTDTYTGLLSSIPDITLLSNSVDVHSVFFLEAFLHNTTGLSFDGSFDMTLLEAWLVANYDFLGLASGNVVNKHIGPAYDASTPFDLGQITVYDDQFLLAGFQAYDGGTFTLSAVPVPAAAWLFGSALLGLATIGRRRS